MTLLTSQRTTAVLLIAGFQFAASSVDLSRFRNLRQSRSLIVPFHGATTTTARIGRAFYFGGQGDDNFRTALGIGALPMATRS